jgi:hypothetical protein
MSSNSPLVNESSFGSSGDALSSVDELILGIVRVNLGEKTSEDPEK